MSKYLDLLSQLYQYKMTGVLLEVLRSISLSGIYTKRRDKLDNNENRGENVHSVRSIIRLNKVEGLSPMPFFLFYSGSYRS